MTTPCQESVSLGAYLLGALEPEERRALEQHIAGCEHCRAELVELAPLPGLMRHTAFDELPESAQVAESLSPAREQREPHGQTGSAELRPLPVPAQHRRRNRGRAALAAGLALAACAAGVGVYAAVDHGSGGRATPTVQAAATWGATDPTTHVSATAALFPEAWGTQFELKLGGLPTDITCHLVVHGKGGLSETAGTWGSGYAPAAQVPASTSISPAQITGLDVVDGTGTLLVHLPAGQ
ncbi:anti-sigma factor family protein [Streptacidiphilus carbonis]|uniref:anti-sigma factor family protein n=1 Tax=Streptacidiphilus carbonis TaxID=105422 RepID=UPI0005AA5B2D|nr:zf-HC2 domain-containing protein [Streptacidiphilus carbonis]